MTVRQSIPRVRRVRMKEGGAELQVLRSKRAERCALMEREFRGMLDAIEEDEKNGPGYELAGFAIVAWNAKGESWARVDAYDGSRIPCSLLPDFVRNRLLSELIERWTLERVDGE